MLKKSIFISVMAITLLVWSLPIMADQPGLTTSYKMDVTNVNIPSSPRPILNQTIIWNNGGTVSGGSAYSSQKDTVYPFVSQVADDFRLTANMLVTDVHWWGAIWNPVQELDPIPFYIYIYADDGTGNAPTGGGMADPSPTALATYFFPSVTGLPLDPNGFHEYNVNLSPPFTAIANVKYWIAIQAKFPYPPQWGWANTTGIQLHQAVQGFPLLGTVFWTNLSPTVDMAFYLTGEPAPEWPDHKMHFPQLPDTIGWDVNATFPKILAEDWQCSQTGWVTDIHFWGSWKDTDGNPTTDNFYTPAPMFILSIHENIPADPDTPWSRPGRQVWGWEGEIPGIPFDPPSLEGWYDPNMDSMICNDHRAFWRYDFAHLPDSFFQYEGQIYWLNVSALGIPPPFQWGWKNSRDHFMDDAVYTDGGPAGPWYPIVEPPRCNWFDVYFPATGIPQDYGSTNYYGQGWYEYESWTNMWFYDNPFTVTHPKHIWLNFFIEPVGPVPSAQFAINWSTPAWDSLEMGRPPLPGENEMLYIGRQVFPVAPGSNIIDYMLPYNPEWVSVDFVATDVMINGWIYHECIGTSLDLAFVITGHEGVPPVICGDVNNNGVVNLGDIVYLISYLYKGGPAPVPSLCVGDVNNDNAVALGDLVYLITYLYKGGPAPDPNCCNPPWK